LLPANVNVGIEEEGREGGEGASFGPFDMRRAASGQFVHL
jgi:hypothetical protein